MVNNFKPAKLLICMVGRRRGEKIVAISKKAGSKGGTIILGRTISKNQLLQAISLADIQEDIVFILLRDEKKAVLDSLKAETLLNKKLSGLAVVIDVSGMLSPTQDLNLKISGDTNKETETKSTNEKTLETDENKMESGYKLITVIVNDGYANDVMAAARKAGATGGTVLTARGTGTEDDVKFFGITLVPEKEMIMMVSKTENVASILAAVSALPNLSEPGGGIVYNMNVEEFFTLGQ
jgi:nitrogen regulatory protein PII